MKCNVSKKHIITAQSMFIWMCVIIFFLSSCNHSQNLSPRCKSALDSLMHLLPQREAIMSEHKAEIDSTDKAITANKNMSLADRFYAYKRLFFKSHLFTVNYSILFSRKMATIADRMNDPVRHAEAMTYYGYSLTRSGLFKEGIDTLSAIQISDAMPDSVLYAYYAYSGRAYHDLSSYGASTINSGRFSKDLFNSKDLQLYINKGNELLSKAIKHTNNKIDVLYLQGKILNFNSNPRLSLQKYMEALKLCKPEDSERLSIILSTLGIIEKRLGNREVATFYDIQAMTNDIRHAIVESNAIGNVAGDLYYDNKENSKTTVILEVAMDNASYYGSRYRINRLGQLIPIAMQQAKNEQEGRNIIMTWAIISLIAIATLLIILLKNNSRTSRILQTKNNEITEAYKQLSVANSRLDNINKKLSEATNLKNQYLGHYMDKEQETINQINAFTILVEQKIALGQTSQLKKILKDFRNAHDQKAERTDFDKTFTAAFPTFVKEFNDLLLPDAKQNPENASKLTPVLRIFALMRLGITDPKRIARALDYTYNTVYNYIVRTRNKAKNPSTFEQDVEKIGL